MMTDCQIRFGLISVKFESPDRTLFKLWTTVFESLLLRETAVPDITIQLETTPQPIPIPEQFDFEDKQVGFGLQLKDRNIDFYFHVGALLTIDLEKRTINGRVRPSAFPHLDDITTICIAPLLRLQNHYLIHSFAAQKGDQTILLVGPSGSGKTTSGLALLQSGWDFLNNDTSLLHDSQKSIQTYPTFDMIRIRSETAALLHEEQFPIYPTTTASFSKAFKIGLGKPAELTAVYFTTIIPNSPTQIKPLPKAVALAKLIEASLDLWDTANMEKHLAFLTRLCDKTAVFELQCGTDIKNLSQIISKNKLQPRFERGSMGQSL